MDIDPVLLARLQFAFTISFHIIFPTFTIGLAAYLATLEVLWGWTGIDRYKRLAAFWTRIFAVSFGMGVVSGVVLSYQIGTNWSHFSTVAGNVIGPLLGYEVLMAFFLEATFLSILLFGGERVPRWLHVFSGIAVAVGTSLSAFWIIAANSWMQTPAGYTLENGIAFPTDWLAIIFNPSFPYRLAHMLNAAFLTTAFVVLAVGARHLLAGRHIEELRTMLRMAIGLTAILAPLQLFIGDQHGLNTLKYQPTKIAAIEGHWDGSKPAAFEIFAWPDEKSESNLYSIAIPHAGSLVLTHQWDGLFPGLKDVPPENRPPVANAFFGFRIMLAVGLYMIAAALFGAWLLWRGRLFETRWYLRIVSQTWWAGFVAVIAGWVVTESGRQPWIINGVLRTTDAVSPVPGASVLTTLILFIAIYLIVFSFGIYFINRLIARGPQDTGLLQSPPRLASGRPTEGGGTAMTIPALPFIWAAILGVAVAFYVILDGFDLGIGILFPFAKSDAERDRMLASIAPFWDGNETWLVLGGAGLLVAFPRAYAIIMPAFYLPLIVMLLALVFRGVTFEFRGVAEHKPLWNTVFAAASTLAALCQGFVLGGLVHGVNVENGAFAGGPFDWATPFGLICALGVVAGYALLGATWLMLKTDGDMARRAAIKAKVLLVAVLVFMAAVSIYTPLAIPRIAARWFTMPNLLYLAPVPILAALVALAEWRWIAKGRETAPFLATIALFLLGYLGLAISAYPYIVPPTLLIRDAAAAPSSQTFMLIGTLVLLPAILGYTAFTYWLFRGKVLEGATYH